MDIKDVYIPDQNYQGTEEELQHGGKWSEEAKERVRQARKAGRSVHDMFTSYYNKQGRSVNKVANRTIYKKNISEARNKLVVAKSNRDLSYKRGVALKNSSSGFVSKGSTPVEKGRRAGTVAKLKRDNDVDKMVKDATVRYHKKELKKSSNHSTGRIAKDATKAISKDVSKKVGKLSKDVGKGLNKTAQKIDQTITSAVNKGVENKGRKTIDKKEKATKALDSKLAEENKVSQKHINDTIEGTIRKNKYSSVGDIVSKKSNKTVSSLKKALKSTNKKLSKTVDDINTNKGKGYQLTTKTTVRPQGEYERYASEVGGGNVYGKRKVAVKKEGTRANSITDALTGKTNAYKEYSTKTEYKTWKEPKKKSKSKPKSKKSNNSTIRQSGLNNIYIPRKTGISDEILKH